MKDAAQKAKAAGPSAEDVCWEIILLLACLFNQSVFVLIILLPHYLLIGREVILMMLPFFVKSPYLIVNHSTIIRLTKHTPFNCLSSIHLLLFI